MRVSSGLWLPKISATKGGSDLQTHLTTQTIVPFSLSRRGGVVVGQVPRGAWSSSTSIPGLDHNSFNAWAICF